MKIGLLGATGYAGLELVQILDKHPVFDLQAIGSRSHRKASLNEITGYPYRQDYTLISLEAFEEALPSLDAVFLSLPHGTSMPWVTKISSLGLPVIDLSGDFRLRSKSLYEHWYQTDHTSESLLCQAVYGLAEYNKKKSKLIANPGCYPTASLLALLPLAQHGLLNNKTLVIDAKSGMSGAGKKLSESILYCESNESMRPYGTGTHRHTPEIEQVLAESGCDGTKVLFSPSVVPMERGILASVYIPMDGSLCSSDILGLYKDYYKDKTFVRLVKSMPQTKHVKNTNYCDIHIVCDERTNTLIVHSVIDNLIKGAAGQAVQNANIYFGLDEWTGLI